MPISNTLGKLRSATLTQPLGRSRPDRLNGPTRRCPERGTSSLSLRSRPSRSAFAASSASSSAPEVCKQALSLCFGETFVKSGGKIRAYNLQKFGAEFRPALGKFSYMLHIPRGKPCVPPRYHILGLPRPLYALTFPMSCPGR
jgi:hypothetical protein